MFASVSLHASYIALSLFFIAAFLCMRLSLLGGVAFTATSSHVAAFSAARKLHSLRATRRTPLHKNYRTTMSSNPSALYTPQDIKGWTALVTGASSGFGKALCGNQPVCRVHGDDAAVLAPSGCEGPTPQTPSSRRRVDGVEATRRKI